MSERKRATRTAVIAGATGLVGRACLDALLRRPDYAYVVALTRRPLEISHPKLREEFVDFGRPESLRPVAADDAFCALGTTIAKAGSTEAFRAVDLRAVITLADLAVQGGVRQFVLVSSVGADATSGNLYLRVKGEAEDAVTRRPFRAVHVLRPGLLLGARNESRPRERLFQKIMPVVDPLLLGPLQKYRAIHATDVGAAMVEAALEGVEGRRVLHYPEMRRYGGELAWSSE